MTEETAEPLLRAARRLSERAGFPVKLQWRQAMGGFPHVVRYAVIGGGDETPPTVILKTPQRAERKAIQRCWREKNGEITPILAYPAF